jgi:hydrogenase-4 component E
MTSLIIVIFAITLIYLSIAERFRHYATLMAFQGLLLFGLSFFELKDISWINLLLITAETLLFKCIIVPYMLSRIISKTRISKVHDHALPGFYSLIFVTFGLVLSIILAYVLKNEFIDQVYFAVALFALYSGLFLIIAHRKIFSHLIGFLMIENAVFLLSLAVGNEMPMLINIGILLDIIVSVLILSVFISRIRGEIYGLTALKD